MTDPNLIGKRLDEYHILSRLGEGGMSTIYLGLDTRLQRYTAIKVIHAHLKDDPDNVARFKREARAVAALDHPNIVRLYRYGQVDDILYMAMQYIEGVDLRVVLRNYRQDGSLIPIADAVRITREICLALDYAHNRGVLHRDVKPSNIMLNREGTAILTDFGLALLPDVDTQGTAFGTPQYMAPEQAQSPTEVGPQSDLYAVGMVLYEMFTGEVPFHEVKNPMEMVALRATTPPPKPTTIQPEINPELEAVILNALALNPAERYQSGTELVAALENSLPAVEEVSVAAVEALPVTVLSEQEAAVPPPVILPPPPPEETSSPATAVPFPPPPAAQNIGRSARRRLAGMPLPLFAAGGCLLLALIAALVVSGGYRFIRDQLASRYQTWIPYTLSGEQEEPSGEAAYPVPPNPGSSEGDSDEIDEEVEDESDEENEEDDQPDSESGDFTLRIATRGDDSFYLINTGDTAVPLPAFLFSDGSHVFGGSEWGISRLGPGECVSVWKDRGNPRRPDVDCREVGERAERAPNETFWKKSFNVIYHNNVIATCPETGCEFSVPND